MSNYAISLKRTSLLLVALSFTALLLVVNFAAFFGRADAAQLPNRSLTTSSSLPGTSTTGAANSETNGSDSTHAFTFEPGSAHTIRSMRFQYCTTAIGTCTAPTNVSVESGTTITVQQLEGVNFANLYAFDATVSDDDELCIENTTGNAVTTGTTQTITVSFDDIRNPDTVAPYFVRITTYSAVDCATAVDDGTVATAITTGIAITSRVAETLGFSTSGALTDTAGGDTDPTASCNPITGTGAITLGDPTENTLAINSTYDNYSGFRIYTNAANATLIQYEGDTLRRSGSVDIDPMATLAAGDFGVEQFGLAADLVNGGTPTVDIASSNTDRDLTYYDTGNPGTGVVDGGAGAGGITLAADYRDGAGTLLDGGAGTASFTFVGDADTSVTPQTIATGSGYIDCSSIAVRYIANIAPTTPAGTYTTTIVYSAVPTY